MLGIWWLAKEEFRYRYEYCKAVGYKTKQNFQFRNIYHQIFHQSTRWNRLQWSSKLSVPILPRIVNLPNLFNRLYSFSIFSYLGRTWQVEIISTPWSWAIRDNERRKTRLPRWFVYIINCAKLTCSTHPIRCYGRGQPRNKFVQIWITMHTVLFIYLQQRTAKEVAVAINWKESHSNQI